MSLLPPFFQEQFTDEEVNKPQKFEIVEPTEINETAENDIVGLMANDVSKEFDKAILESLSKSAAQFSIISDTEKGNYFNEDTNTMHLNFEESVYLDNGHLEVVRELLKIAGYKWCDGDDLTVSTLEKNHLHIDSDYEVFLDAGSVDITDLFEQAIEFNKDMLNVEDNNDYPTISLDDSIFFSHYDLACNEILLAEENPDIDGDAYKINLTQLNRKLACATLHHNGFTTRSNGSCKEITEDHVFVNIDQKTVSIDSNGEFFKESKCVDITDLFQAFE